MSTNRNLYISTDTRIELERISITERNSHTIVIGNKEIGSYVLLDRKWKSVLSEFLQRPMSIRDYLARANANVTEAQLKIVFVFLAKYGFVKQLDAQIIAKKTHTKLHVFTLPHWITMIFVNPITKLFFLSLAFSAIILPLLFHQLLPYTVQFVWHEYVSITILTYLLISWCTVFLHEGAHIMVAQYFGISTGVRLSHRFHYLVMETYYPDSIILSKYKKMLLYGAGICIDLSILGLGYILLLLSDYQHIVLSESFIRLIRQLLLVQWAGLLWQGLIYMKTDLYFIVKEVTDTENLSDKGWEFLIQIWRKKKLPVVNTSVFLYGFLLVVSYPIAVIRYITIHIPIVLWMTVNAVSQLLTYKNTTQKEFIWDSIVTLVLLAMLYSLLVYSLIGRIQRRAVSYG